MGQGSHVTQKSQNRSHGGLEEFSKDGFGSRFKM
jgi:hypothetical protein